MLKNLILLIVVSVVAVSCGMQKRIAETAEKNRATKEAIKGNTATLNDVNATASEKLSNQSMDTSISGNVSSTVSSLYAQLEKTQRTVDAIDFFLTKKSNFTPRNYNARVKPYVEQLDSFQIQRKTRERIYTLLSDAVTATTFQQHKMGAFYKPGAYKMPTQDFTAVSGMFLPAIDSMAALSNKYADVNRTIHLVIVGYADATKISENSKLYTELKDYLKASEPQPGQLNLALSDKRAQELLRNIKTLVRDNASKFKGYNHLKIGYLSYGRGEELPFKTITDYTVDDDRRRVVVFYWAILPQF